MTSSSADAAPDCLNDARCSEHYESARRLSLAGQYEAALVNYQSAYAVVPSPWLLVNIGRMQQRSGRPRQAVATFRRYLGDPRAQTDGESLAKAHEYLVQAESEAAVQSGSAAGGGTVHRSATPIYKRWWLWTVIGGATAAIAVGLGAGLTHGLSSSMPGMTHEIAPGVSVYEPKF